MIYIDRNLRIPGIRPDAPSLDAAAYLGDRITAAESDNRVKADDVAASRPAVAALKNIAAIDFTPAVASQLAAVLSNLVAEASWSHFPGVEDALASLDSASDSLEAI